MYVSREGPNGKKFTLSYVDKRNHFSFTTSSGNTIDYVWYDDIILKNTNHRYVLLVFKDGRVLVANSNASLGQGIRETICTEVFLAEFDIAFRSDETLLAQLPNCVRCMEGLRYHKTDCGKIDITDGGGTPLFNIDDGRLVISKVTAERIRSKLDGLVAMDVTYLYRQLINFVNGVTSVI